MSSGTDTNIAEFTDDALGRRIEKYDVFRNLRERNYYDGQRAVVKALVNTAGSEGDTWSFVYGNYIDEALLMIYPGDYYCFYAHDHLYSPVTLTFETSVIERYEYDAYGKPTFYSASWGTYDSFQTISNIGFTGRELDVLDNGSLQIMYYRARCYDPETGRFMQRDPLLYVDGMNIYLYTLSNPLGKSDPYGTMSNPIQRPPVDPKSVCPINYLEEQHWEDRYIWARWETLKYRANKPWPFNVYVYETLYEMVNYQVYGYIPVNIKLIGTGPDGKWTDADMLIFVGTGYITPDKATIESLIKLNKEGKTYACRRLYKCISKCCFGQTTTRNFELPGVMAPVDTSGIGNGNCIPFGDPSDECPVIKSRS